jgi:hypothetical protein
MSAKTAAGSHRLRSLNRPRPIGIETDEGGLPIAAHISNRRCAVESVIETWRIDDEWWRERPVSRVYYSLLLEDGRAVDVYRDLVSGRWFRQAY